ncbi:hypothetical protein [Rhizohabitans arisaemae]|uniref:hypothetical protein n=1 Tax=Rhizohabitans arisaemae TaxID=2720610 RepID=UPI0024B06090|nr:hypothetical protein [Rhizohabitans arisaemae]
MNNRTRLIVAAAFAVVLTVAAGAYVLYARERTTTAVTAAPSPGVSYGPVTVGAAEGAMLMVTAGGGAGSGRVAEVAGGSRTVSDLRCVRFYAVEGTAVCLTAERGARTRYFAKVLGPDLRELRSVELQGVPSRARISRSGRMIAWTVFVSGDSYLASGLSTRTGILDAKTGKVVRNMEEFQLFRDGKRLQAVDLNYWGVTFTGDEDTYYATVSTGGELFLVRGRVSARRAEVIAKDVECPSLSPDGTRLVYKKRTGEATRPWRLYVRDLASGRETPLAERENVDDQAAWLDGQTVMYARLRGDSTDVWAVPADGSGEPRLIARDAFSPVPPIPRSG